ncbi:MAG: glycoside hydrolase family 20 zincin-like fold domain-containing protein [Ginsengibacter sp.]
MQQLRRSILFVFLLTGLYASAQNIKDFEKHFKLMPRPQKTELMNQKGISATSLQSIYLHGNAVRPVLTGLLATLPLAQKSEAGALLLNISTDKNIPSSVEGYIIEVKNNLVTITSRDQGGLFYGCQTLNQLLEDAHDQNINIPACRITDYPDVAYRAIHLDLKHHVNTNNFYYDLMDRLASIKINAVIVEFEDKLRYRKAPLVGSGNAISVDEFAAISRYAKERNIEISPLIQGLGHAEFILKHEKYASLRDTITSDWSFDPMKAETYELQFSLYEDAIAATPYGKYLHVGGDEVGHLGMSELSKKSGLTPLQLQMLWLNKVSEFAVKNGRIPIFWDDMVFKLSDLYQTTWDPELPAQTVKDAWVKNEHRLEENISLFPKECVYMRWNYDAPDIPGNHKALDWYKSHNLKVMAATSVQAMWPMLPRANSNFQPVKDFSRMTAEKKLDGILCTSWDDCSPHAETLWRGFYDFSFFSWHYIDATADNVHAMFRHRFYAPALEATSFDFQDQLEKALVFWETALINKGDRNNYHKTIDLIALPDAANVNKWSGDYKEKLAHAKEEIKRHNLIRDQLTKAMQVTRRNEYALSVLNRINELQSYSAGLLLLLEKYDKASSTNRESIKKDIGKFVSHFEDVRKNFENVFSKTRILSNPDNYVRDQNQHEHLANGTNNSDWMFVYELAINKKINDWLAGNK